MRRAGAPPEPYDQEIREARLDPGKATHLSAPERSTLNPWPAPGTQFLVAKDAPRDEHGFTTTRNRAITVNNIRWTGLVDATVIKDKVSAHTAVLNRWVAAIRQADLRLKEAWLDLQREKKIERFHRMLRIARSWSQMNLVSPDDKRSLGHKFLSHQRISIRNKAIVDTSVIIALILAVVFFVIFLAVIQNITIFGVNIQSLPSLAQIENDIESNTVLYHIAQVLGLISASTLSVSVVTALLRCWTIAAMALIAGLIMGFSASLMVLSQIAFQMVVCSFNGITTCGKISEYIAVVPILFMVWIAFGFFAFLIVRFHKLLVVDFERRHPEETIVNILFDVIGLLEKGPSILASVSDRAKLIENIERVARIVRTRLISRIPTSDSAIKARQVQQAHLISQRFRERAAWLLTPKWQTTDELLTYFSKILISLLRGTWDDFFDHSQGEGETEIPPGDMRGSLALIVLRKTGSILRTIVVAGLPVVIYYLAQKYDVMGTGKPILEVVEPANTYIRGGLLAWIMIVIISEIDPSWSRHVTGVKDLVGLASGKSKKE
jgi:hypothetical protein